MIVSLGMVRDYTHNLIQIDVQDSGLETKECCLMMIHGPAKDHQLNKKLKKITKNKKLQARVVSRGGKTLLTYN